MKEIPVTAVWLEKLELYSSFLQWYTEFGHQKLIRSLYDRMSATDKATELGKAITGYMNLPELVDVGDDMVDGDLYDLEGKVRHLSEFKGKYILLDFWSQGCGPCFQSLPEMDFITQQYAGKMEVVSHIRTFKTVIEFQLVLSAFQQMPRSFRKILLMAVWQGEVFKLYDYVFFHFS